MTTALNLTIEHAAHVFNDSMTLEMVGSHMTTGEGAALAGIFHEAGHHTLALAVAEAFVEYDPDVQLVIRTDDTGSTVEFFPNEIPDQDPYWVHHYEGMTLEDVCERLGCHILDRTDDGLGFIIATN